MSKPENPPLFTCGNCKHCGSRWHLADYCLANKPLTFLPLCVTPDGEALGPYPQSDMADSRLIGLCFATHYVCNGFIDLKEVTQIHNAIVCRSCKLRVVIPGTLETWGDLRRHFNQEDLTGKKVHFRDEGHVIQVGTVIALDRRTTRPDFWAIVPDGQAEGGSYSRHRSEIGICNPVAFEAGDL